MKAILLIARRTMRDSLRDRWIIAATLLMAALALALAFLGSAPVGKVAASPLAVTVVSLATLSVFLVPLIALLLSYDAIVGDVDRGTMLLLLSYPVTRAQVILGKYAGQLGSITVATLLGYGGTGLVLGFGTDNASAADWAAFGSLILSTIALGACFLALGLMISAFAGARGTAAGAAVALWLGFVVLYDLGLLGLLVADSENVISAAQFNLLLLLNPTDAYRVLNLTLVEEVRAYAGLVGPAAEGIRPTAVLVALAGWIVAPLAVAMIRFQRSEI